MPIIMATLIKDLARLLKQIERWPITIECESEEMLITMSLPTGRTQTVRVWTDKSMDGSCSLVKLQSRATVAHDYKTAQSAIVTNANLEIGGLGLDLSTQPPAVDVLYSLVADQLHFDDFLWGLQWIAAYADSIEERTIGGDAF